MFLPKDSVLLTLKVDTTPLKNMHLNTLGYNMNLSIKVIEIKKKNIHISKKIRLYHFAVPPPEAIAF